MQECAFLAFTSAAAEVGYLYNEADVFIEHKLQV